MSSRHISVAGLGQLPAFSHAVVAGDFIFVSGTLGTVGPGLELVEGGAGPQTRRALGHIATILAEAGAGLADLVKVNVYLADIGDFGAMNEAYLSVIEGEPPARITVGRAELALGAAVEIDAVAYRASDPHRPEISGTQ